MDSSDGDSAHNDCSISVTCESTGTNPETLKEMMRRTGLPLIRKALKSYCEEFNTMCGLAKTGGIVTSSSKTTINSSTEAKPKPIKPVAPQVTPTLPTVSQSQSPAKTTTKLELSYEFEVAPEVLYQTVLDASRVSAFTQSAAICEGRVDGIFSLYNGSVKGKYLEIVPNERIVHTWHFNTWAENAISTVTLTFTSIREGAATKVHLLHTDIPTRDKDGSSDTLSRLESGWKLHYWDRIRALFGMGTSFFINGQMRLICV